MIVLTRAEVEARGHPVWTEVDLGAIRHNVRVLRDRARSAELMGVVKGYAYGHGNPACANAVLEAGATRLGVARVAEALHLRESGIDVPIHVFSEPPHAAAEAIVDHDLTATVYTTDFARRLSSAAGTAGRTVKVHVKIDTGMHRVGLPAEEALAAVQRIADLPNLEVEGAWSHLAVADVPDHPFTRKQLDLFLDVVGRIEKVVDLRFRHIANSAATLSFEDGHLDLVRCGIACYGLWPGPQLVGSADLRPALSLKARVTMAKKVAAGEALSYGLEYSLAAAGKVLTVACGYADGYDRRLSGVGDVAIRGRRYRVSGTVCMDQFMVDIGNDDVAIGETVTLIGRDGDEAITAEDVAARVGTINYEVTARIPSRVPRIYLDGDDGET